MPIAVPEIRSNNPCVFAGESDVPASDAVETTIGQHRARSEGTTALGANRPRPAWGWLYAVLPLTVLLFLLGDMLPATSEWRTMAEMIAALVVIGAIAFWVHTNRLALILAEYNGQSGSTPDPR